MSASSELIIRHRSGDCRVLIQSGLIHQMGAAIRETKIGGKAGNCAVITDRNVGALYMDAALASLRTAGFQPLPVEVPAGEVSKSLSIVSSLIDQLAAAKLDRHSFIVALGGGVIGDLAGFVASIYYRGISYIQVPTTVISQCDSAIGGKTGVNTVKAKNLVGSFYPAQLVLVDPDVLNSLPEREFCEGFAEVIKHGIIADPEMFAELANFDRANLQAVVRRNLEIKAEIVGADEFETTGVRAKLNFGHTIGHGIEQAAGYGRLLHGEAISLGIVAASKISMRKAGLAVGEIEQIVARLQQFHLPIKLPADISTEAVTDSLMLDKKFSEGNIRFVLAPRIGEAVLSAPGKVTLDDLKFAIEELRD